ncbi:MAG: helix-turn-helix transcriptional regulator [Myxococcales bacterium]|nr:helix-turn-helix transcriptional regulator [Myxococcales bacterium]
MHVVLACQGTLRLSVEGETIEAPGIVTAPDVPHALDAAGGEILLVFVDPESVVGAALLPALGAPVRALDDAHRTALVVDEAEALFGPEGLAWTARLVALLAGDRAPAPRPALHPRVRKVLRLLRERLPDGDVSLASLAAEVELSPGRLMHAFTTSIGLPLRPYLSWLRLQRAAAAIVSGAPLAQAAATAGFSDAAHMSRMFRRMLGMPPSALRPTP